MGNNDNYYPTRTCKVSTSELPNLIDLCYRSKNNLLVVGNPGTGKSTVIKAMENEGYKVTMLTGSSTYEETVNGIPYRDAGNKSKTGNDMSVYNVPKWLEDINNYDGKQILFIDEFNTAEPQVIKTFLSILTERKVPTQPDELMIPDNCVIVAAMNPAEQNDGEQLIRPLKSRFMVVEITSTREDFKKYIVANYRSEHMPTEDIEALLEATLLDRWGYECQYNELNPRSFTNFLRAMDAEADSGKDLKTVCPTLSMAFFGQSIDYPTAESKEQAEEQARLEKVKKNPYPTREELEQLPDDELRRLYSKLSTKFNKKADLVCLDIQDILEAREKDNGTTN